jgi:hypothetical protein
MAKTKTYAVIYERNEKGLWFAHGTGLQPGRDVVGEHGVRTLCLRAARRLEVAGLIRMPAAVLRRHDGVAARVLGGSHRKERSVVNVPGRRQGHRKSQRRRVEFERLQTPAYAQTVDRSLQHQPAADDVKAR